MGKELSKMTLKELWELFPIFLTEHQPEWKSWYLEQHEDLCKIIPLEETVRISHIGSTAVPHIWAKPIIDILVELKAECDMSSIEALLIEQGWICMGRNEGRLSFNKGYTEQGFAERVYHLHLRYAGDNDELYFRDCLMGFPDRAKEYEAMKLGLWKKFEHDRDAYTNAKTDFVKRCTRYARERYKGRYG